MRNLSKKKNPFKMSTSALELLQRVDVFIEEFQDQGSLRVPRLRLLLSIRTLGGRTNLGPRVGARHNQNWIDQIIHKLHSRQIAVKILRFKGECNYHQVLTLMFMFIPLKLTNLMECFAETVKDIQVFGGFKKITWIMKINQNWDF